MRENQTMSGSRERVPSEAALTQAALQFLEWVNADIAAEIECQRLRAPVVRLENALNAYIEQHDLDLDEVQVRASELGGQNVGRGSA
jgi:hypothetical protein